MILSTMTYPEMINEIEKDYLALFTYAEKAINQKKYYKCAMKNPDPIYFNPIYWTSKRKNKYVIIPMSLGKKYMKKHGISYGVFCYYNGEKNHLNAIVVTRNKEYTFYSGHLFDRYVERFLNDTSMTKLETMVEFMRYNSTYVSIPFFSATKYENAIFAKVEDGIILGSREEDYDIFNTFITEDMVKGTEIGYNAFSKNALNNYLELIDKGLEDKIENFDEEMSKNMRLYVKNGQIEVA